MRADWLPLYFRAEFPSECAFHEPSSPPNAVRRSLNEFASLLTLPGRDQPRRMLLPRLRCAGTLSCNRERELTCSSADLHGASPAPTASRSAWSAPGRNGQAQASLEWRGRRFRGLPMFVQLLYFAQFWPWAVVLSAPEIFTFAAVLRSSPNQRVRANRTGSLVGAAGLCKVIPR
jgi:hypothetical protein